ncbi:hypothetical protein A3H03_03005 [Candidatus Kuenenbacteria bacterium RIFCSPLOWO2_12_FULL_42_13]|uniref:ABC transporter domain-containing protein n=1 Tax=Candidatus Kuenenbacteria bacterium RIFCSPLOWO2_12_FULL_42_13 TaxID=1798565 RepID=A0A1F6G0J5_9BACT|nr:MAG: hypothetical protein A3C68_01845 [Candidatus Kuenenbacteria bacterium RIFCSPHIGHO2_02_FULL_42_29]OGG91633.1 MAG: hypothetical protein A3H03_03005 [Candidatus Kuenenbacteria bacterium RIFCSPLOWO2_12_FULL_42_13]
MIEVKSLSKNFGENKVLEDISFEINKGEIVGLLGPNGAGKTTAMRILAGFLLADKGEVVIAGNDMSKDKEALLAKQKIGYLPENNPLYPEMLVKEYLGTMVDFKIKDKNKKQAAIKRAVTKTGVKEVFYKQIADLSKGFKQRVGLAASILGEPEILILDEPTEGLDPNQRVDIRNLIKNLGQEKTVIISSHVLAEIENTCERVIILNKGKIVADGATREIIEGTQSKKRLFLEIEGRGIEENIRQIADQQNIKTLKPENHKTKIVLEIEKELRPEISRMARANDWIIWEMRQKEVSLEDVFRELTKE